MGGKSPPPKVNGGGGSRPNPGAGSESSLRSGRARLGVGVKRLNRHGPIPQVYDLSRVRFVALQPLLLHVDGPAVYLDSSEQGNGGGDEE